MRLYSSEVESNIHLERQIRDWTQSGMLSASESAILRRDVRVDLKRTNIFLRAVLFIFTLLIVAAAVALVAASIQLDDNTLGILCVISGAFAFLVAEVLVREFQMYRFGVEEGLAVISVILLSFGVSMAMGFQLFGNASRVPLIIGISTAILVSIAVYLRFGYLYAAAFALIGLGSWAFEIATTETGKIALAAALLMASAVVARILRRRCDKDYLAEELGAIETFAFIGAYLILNIHLRIESDGISTVLRHQLPTSFYWFTYAAVWILPVIGLVLSLGEKHRFMILASTGLALATLFTNKPYLGREQQTWDAILFGLFLIGVALAVKRWLASGPGGYRYGYTGARLLYGDKQILAVVGTASALQGANTASITHTDSSNSLHAGGGYSGGGGASGDF
jgi:hypothetical protein